MTTKKNVASAFDRVDRATARAFQTHERLLGKNSNEDVAFYETLGQDDFDKIKEVYGPDGVTDYIQAMEAKRLRGRG